MFVGESDPVKGETIGTIRFFNAELPKFRRASWLKESEMVCCGGCNDDSVVSSFFDFPAEVGFFENLDVIFIESFYLFEDMLWNHESVRII